MTATQGIEPAVPAPGRMTEAEFRSLLPLCEREGRWSFLCVIAPLRLPTGTGSPVNPIAIM